MELLCKALVGSARIPVYRKRRFEQARSQIGTLGMSGSIMSNYQRAESRRAKLERNLHLLELDNADRPDDLFTLLKSRRDAAPLGKAEKDLAEASPDQVAIS